MSWQKGDFLYEGKAKKIFKVASHDDLLWLDFKDSLTAFNGVKKDEMAGKGALNRDIAAAIFAYLKDNGVDSHCRGSVDDNVMICEPLEIIPLEVVVRNVLAGSTAKKFAIKEGTPLEKPLCEFYYKKDELNDPFISDDQALMLKAVERQEQLDELKVRALKINELLKDLFAKAKIQLVDYKLEFGINRAGKIVLGDEITPDSCRLWDMETGEKLDKDRFRRDLGNVLESYRQVWKRLQTVLD